MSSTADTLNVEHDKNPLFMEEHLTYEIPTVESEHSFNLEVNELLVFADIFLNVFLMFKVAS